MALVHAARKTGQEPPPRVVVERLGRGTPRPEWVPYEPLGAARELMRCRLPEVGLEGPADTGKSMGCLNKVYLANVNYARNRTAIVRKRRVDLTHSAMVSFEQKVMPAGAARFHDGDQEYKFPNGSVCVVGGLDDPGKVLSTEYDLVYVQEADQLTLEDWETLRTRVTGRWGAMPYAQIIADWNPTDPGHWLYQREKAGQLLVLAATHADNPTVTEERLDALRSLTGYRYRRLYLGERVAAEGMYFEEWDPTVHVVDPFPIPAHWTRWSATDYGFAAPFCHLAFAREPGTRTIYVHRELYAAGLHDHQQADLITKRIKEEREAVHADPKATLYALHVGDPSMFAKRSEHDLPSIASVYQGKGIDLQPASNNRKQGWSVVRRTMTRVDGKPSRLRVFRTCPNLIRTLPAMVRDPLDPEDLADEIKGKKTEDHACDALRYGLVAEASPPTPVVSSARFAR